MAPTTDARTRHERIASRMAVSATVLLGLSVGSIATLVVTDGAGVVGRLAASVLALSGAALVVVGGRLAAYRRAIRPESDPHLLHRPPVRPEEFRWWRPAHWLLAVVLGAVVAIQLSALAGS